ncbi:MAG: HAD-IC family P-type ATPase [Candidatus Micrarchaeota archaeon]
MDLQGLSTKEAANQFKKYGPNELEKKRRTNAIELFLNQFMSFIIILLVIASAVSFFVGDSLNSVAILVAVMLSVSLSAIQEYRGERAMESLMRMTATKARVMRDGEEEILETRELVPMDVVVLNEGDKVPADVELLKSTGLVVDESMLTGESVPVEKDAVLKDEGRLLYMGTVVTRGVGTGIVIGTGMRTEMGRIMKTIQVKEEKTPLQRKLDWLAGRIGIIGMMACAIIFVIGIVAYPEIPTDEMFLIAITLAVASVPEGLPTTVTITLAIGMKRMAARNAIVRKLLAVESLGSITVICSDKTGTITKNMMTVKSVFVDMQYVKVTGDGYDGPGRLLADGKVVGKPKGTLKMLLETSILCNTAGITRVNGRAEAIGDPTEVSLLVLAEKAGIDYKVLRKKNVVDGDPLFDTRKKLMVSINGVGNMRMAFVKGAFEEIIDRSSTVVVGGIQRRMSREYKKTLYEQSEVMAGQGMRVLAFAQKRLKTNSRDTGKGLVLLGLVGMVDPPREEVSDSVKRCREAGIRVVMITGDSPITAKAIATEVGIFREGDRIVTGIELERMNDRELRAVSRSVSVYARVVPEDKLRIVSALKSGGNIVAMTGDGVNDVPSLKKADVGVSMGSGTDVAKEVSEIVLADDNFATIVKAVEYGRNMYDNIRNFVRFQFSTNVAAVATMFIVPFFPFMRLPLPFTPLGLLWINIIMDGPPALALGMEPPRVGIMKRTPRDPEESIVSGLMHGILVTGAVMCIGTILPLVLSLKRAPEEAATIAFTGFVVFQLFNALNCRSNKESLFSNFFRNKYLMLALLACAVLQVCIVYLEPLQKIFKTTAIGFGDWILIILVAGSVLVVEEIRKFFVRKSDVDDVQC